jgi:hypothetical protein
LKFYLKIFGESKRSTARFLTNFEFENTEVSIREEDVKLLIKRLKNVLFYQYSQQNPQEALSEYV